MKCYHVLECADQNLIADQLHGFLERKKYFEKQDMQFWNFLSKQDLYELLNGCPNLVCWFDDLGLKAREGSFTIWNGKIRTHPHVDAPPVIAKINFPVRNTQDTYNVWFDEKGKEIDRVECVCPIVLRSNLLHTVEVGHRAKFPRIQMSFCFFREPINYLV